MVEFTAFYTRFMGDYKLPRIMNVA